jgi:hypothetical protein
MDDDRIRQIQQRLIELENEEKSLKEELSTLKKYKQIDSYGQPIREAPPQTNDEKIDLFLELFCCRTDVFPKLWENKSKGTKGYSPACRNEWVANICGKPKTKCADCQNRNFILLDKENIKNHLIGKITIGMYAIRQDDTCIFLAADFDKSTWEKDVTGYKNAGAKLGVPVYIERSRSGNGAHAWILPVRWVKRKGKKILKLSSIVSRIK